MDTAVAARPLTVVDFATPADDAALRQLLRDTPMNGSVQVSLEREPSFFAAVRLEAERHYTVCARDAQTDRVFAMGSRSVRRLFVNGQPQRVGYLSQLRIAPSHRHLGRQVMRAGYRLLGETRSADEAPFDITTIVADNTIARRLLEAGLPGLPRYTPVERLLTLLLPVRPGFHTCASVEFRAQRCRQHPNDCQFAPVWIDDDLARMDAVHRVGNTCVARWDQRAFKQAVVREYSPWLRRCRWLLGLPPTGSVAPLAYLCVLAMNDNDPDEFLRLLEEALRSARQTDCRWLALGLAARHPFVPVLFRRYRPRTYESILYVVHEPGTTVTLDGRLAHVEVALL